MTARGIAGLPYCSYGGEPGNNLLPIGDACRRKVSISQSELGCRVINYYIITIITVVQFYNCHSRNSRIHFFPTVYAA